MTPKLGMYSKLSLGVLFFVFFGLIAFEQPLLQDLSAQSPINPATIVGEYDPESLGGQFHGQSVNSYQFEFSPLRHVLGVSDAPKHIEVDLAKQRLYAFEGSTKVYDFPISSGKWGKTPTGTFTIWGKFRYTKMSGGSKALRTYYYLPNVPFVMFFANSEIVPSRGFGLHGTYWHNNFGHPMSHGCINMRTEDAGTIFYWSTPSVGDKSTARASSEDQGTEVIIYGTAPTE